MGLDNKSGIPVGRKLDFSATQRQSGRKNFKDIDETVSRYHDFKYEKVVAYVIHQLNVVKYVESNKYSGETEVNFTIAVPLHDSTLEPSDILTHNTCFLNNMEALETAAMNKYTF